MNYLSHFIYVIIVSVSPPLNIYCRLFTIASPKAHYELRCYNLCFGLFTVLIFVICPRRWPVGVRFIPLCWFLWPVLAIFIKKWSTYFFISKNEFSSSEIFNNCY